MVSPAPQYTMMPYKVSGVATVVVKIAVDGPGPVDFKLANLFGVSPVWTQTFWTSEPSLQVTVSVIITVAEFVVFVGAAELGSAVPAMLAVQLTASRAPTARAARRSFMALHMQMLA